jgi:hypothetical protein
MERTTSARGAVLNMIIGAFMALIFLGLPLAIIGLFIASTLDRRGGRPPEHFVSSMGNPAAALVTNDRRRRIIYGKHSVDTRALAERPRPTSIHSGKV